MMVHAIRPAWLTPLQIQGLQELAIRRKYYARRIIRLRGADGGREIEKKEKERTMDRERETEGRKEGRLGKRREGAEWKWRKVRKKVGGWQRCLAREVWCGYCT